jgi:hypothetical protein
MFRKVLVKERYGSSRCVFPASLVRYLTLSVANHQYRAHGFKRRPLKIRVLHQPLETISFSLEVVHLQPQQNFH